MRSDSINVSKAITPNRCIRAVFAWATSIAVGTSLLAAVPLTAQELDLAQPASFAQSQSTDKPAPPPPLPPGDKSPLPAPTVPNKTPAATPPSPAPATTAPGNKQPAPPQTPRLIPDPTAADARRVVQPQDFNVNNLNNPVGLAAGPVSLSPAMIGDFFGGTGSKSTVYTLTPMTVPNLSVINHQFFTGQATPPIDRLGFGDTAQFPTPYFLSDQPTPLVGPGQQVPLASSQPNIMPDGTAPVVPGSSPLVGIGTATINAVPAPGPPQVGLLGTATATFQIATPLVVNIPNPGSGGGVGGQKIMEGNSPMPRDRVFLMYDLFENVPLTATGVNVNRMTPGFEKTFFDRQMSFEIRFPMALTLDSNITTGQTITSNPEFGNIAMAVKALLLSDGIWSYSGGLGITIPTADDTNVFLPDGTQIVAIQNRATHVQPFLGALWTPNDSWFSQSFLQVDVDTSGNPVMGLAAGNQMTKIGQLQSSTFLFASTGLGRWLMRGNRSGPLTGLACMMEVHYNRSLQPNDIVVGGPLAIGDFSKSIELLNLSMGTTFELRNRGYLTAAYVTPLGGGSDQQFDGQFRLLYNRRFGPNVGRARF
jgi:hypothetical protein